MSLNVALIDKSEIIKKMLSHCLYYYSAEIHRFETLDDLKSQSKHLKPDIIFIDWDLKKGDEHLAISAKKEIKNVPLVAIYRDGSDEKITSFTNRIKKPLDANLLRKMVADLIPKIGQSKIHSFLKFPKNQDKIKEQEESKTKEVLGVKKEPSEKTLEESVINFDLMDLESSEETKTDIHLDKISTTQNDATDTKKADLNLIDGINDDSIKNNQDKTTFKSTKKNSSETTFKKEKPKIKKKPLFNKDRIKLDETTFNDFAPMAVKSSDEERTDSQISMENKNTIKIKDEMILKALEEYKNTLQFEKLMELSLKNYAKNLSVKIIEKDQGEILKKSLSDFKKEDGFKQLILKTLQEYIKENSEFRSLFQKELQKFIIKELPRLAKKVIEKEIKKILEETN